MKIQSAAPFVLLAISVTLYLMTDTQNNQQQEKKELMIFEKHELVGVEIKRPEREDITLRAHEDGWKIEDLQLPANTTMINRIKHQLHDLTSRAEVLPPGAHQDLERYGLGSKGVDVRLVFKDGSLKQFVAGDENPTGVSHYIQVSDGAVHTVKKSSMDYFRAPVDAFREERFISVNSRALTRLSTEIGDTAREFILEEQIWKMLGEGIIVDEDRIRRMVGRIAALKAIDYIDPDEQQQDYGFSKPTLKVTIEQRGLPTNELLMGAPYDENHAYFKVAGDPVVYVARSALLEEFVVPEDMLHIRKPFSIQAEQIEWMTLQATNSELSTIRLEKKGTSWFWSEGWPISGSTPSRLAQAISRLYAYELAKDHSLIEADYLISIFDGFTEHQVAVGSSAKMENAQETDRSFRYMQLLSSGYIEIPFKGDEQIHRICSDVVREARRHYKEHASKKGRRKDLEGK